VIRGKIASGGMVVLHTDLRPRCGDSLISIVIFPYSTKTVSKKFVARPHRTPLSPSISSFTGDAVTDAVVALLGGVDAELDPYVTQA
jgi:hypothetical protein